MPRENNPSNFMSLLLESEEQSQLSFSEQENDTEDDYSWQQAFTEIGIDPLGLPDLKLTRQVGRYFDEEDNLGPTLNL